MIIVGIDPDAEKHGVAVYEDGQLIHLARCQAIEIMEHHEEGTIYSIENVIANQFIYGRNIKGNKTVQSKIAMSVGRVQQAQIELMRVMDHYDMPYVLHKPQSGNWAKDRAMFERITGWTGSSNEDTRAAAFFGALALSDAGISIRKVAA